MTEQPQDLTSQLAALQKQIAALATQQTPTAPASPWGAPTSAPPINGVAIPIKLQTPAGTLRVYLSLPAECGASIQTLMATIETLYALGMPLDTWQSGSDWSSWGNSNRGKWRR